MTRRDLAVGAGALATLASGLGRGSEATAAVASDAVRGRVTALLDTWGASWNAGDMDAMALLFTEDAHWVNIVGMHWQGRDAIMRAHRVFFEMMFKGVPTALEEIESVMPLPGGAAVVVARFTVGAFRQPGGVVKPASRDRMTLVLVPAGDRLLIAHGANVGIIEDAQRFDPVRGPDRG